MNDQEHLEATKQQLSKEELDAIGLRMTQIQDADFGFMFYKNGVPWLQFLLSNESLDYLSEKHAAFCLNKRPYKIYIGVEKEATTLVDDDSSVTFTCVDK